MKKQNKKIKASKYPLVKIVWRDSNMYRFQDSIEYALGNYAVEVITTIGFLIGYNDNDPILSRDLLKENTDQRCSIVIPKENIVSLTKIKTKVGTDDLSDEEMWSRKMEDKPLVKSK